MSTSFAKWTDALAHHDYKLFSNMHWRTLLTHFLPLTVISIIVELQLHSSFQHHCSNASKRFFSSPAYWGMIFIEFFLQQFDLKPSLTDVNKIASVQSFRSYSVPNARLSFSSLSNSGASHIYSAGHFIYWLLPKCFIINVLVVQHSNILLILFWKRLFSFANQEISGYYSFVLCCPNSSKFSSPLLQLWNSLTQWEYFDYLICRFTSTQNNPHHQMKLHCPYR